MARDAMKPSLRSLPGLTGLRAVAALLVVFYHLREVRNGTFYDFGWLDTLFEFGHLGVDVFFILSGFIIYHAYRHTFSASLEARSYVEFLQNRLARLYPVHLVTLVLMLGVYWVGKYRFDVIPNNEAYYTLSSVLNNLTMTHAWFPGVGAPNSPAWSISTEWFAYLLFPLLCVGLGRAPRATAVLVVPPALIGAHFLFGVHPLLRIGTEFVLGMALCELRSRYDADALLGRYTSLIVATAAVGTLYFLGAPLLMLHVGLFGLLIVALANPHDVGARILSHPALVYLGEISYSIYMGHWIIWASLKHAAPRVMPWLVTADLTLIMLGLVGSVAFAAALYHFVEVPGRRAIRGWSLNRFAWRTDADGAKRSATSG